MLPDHLDPHDPDLRVLLERAWKHGWDHGYSDASGATYTALSKQLRIRKAESVEICMGPGIDEVLGLARDESPTDPSGPGDQADAMLRAQREK